MVANTRQLSLVSVEELSEIASRLGITHIDPAWMAANIATDGAGPITQLPPGTLLRASSGASIYVAELNSPCRVAARLIAQHADYTGDASAFVRHAKGRRGVVGFVYASGTLNVGDGLEVLQAKPQPPQD
jgi:MOSC domain-containing protein YiiM